MVVVKKKRLPISSISPYEVVDAGCFYFTRRIQEGLNRLNREIINSERDKRQNKMAIPPDFSIENARINSFESWAVSFISPANLAMSGFYYSPRSFDVCGYKMDHIIDDRVRCLSCGIELVKWEVGDE